jgi:hypothetical protein
MVKRTVAVLGILAIALTAGTSFAFWNAWDSCGGPADCKPMYLPVDCPTPPLKTIVKTWAIKIEGPCPAPGVGCGPAMCRERGGFDLCSIVTALASPFDWLFGGTDGVYGCFGGLGGCGGADGPCGPCYGPLGCTLAGLPTVLGAPLFGGGLFGTWW